MLVTHVGIARLEPPASRVLEVRIARGAGSGYAVDLAIKDPEGHVLTPDHTEYPGKVSCFEVVYNTAYRAAVLMGAFKLPDEPSASPKVGGSAEAPSSQAEVPAPGTPLSEPARCPAEPPPGRYG
jgi:hypothetical protein